MVTIIKSENALGTVLPGVDNIAIFDTIGNTVDSGVPITSAIVISGEVSTYADLPSASLHTNEIWKVDNSSAGHPAGLYQSNGTTWIIYSITPSSGSPPIAYDPTTGIIGLNYNTTNFKLTSNALNTIQDIALASSPQFTGLNLSGLTASSLVTTDSSKNLISANLSGDVTSSGLVTTLATVNSNIGTFGSATQVPQFTVNGKGLITAVTNVSITGLTPGTLSLNSGQIIVGNVSNVGAAVSMSGGATISNSGVVSLTNGAVTGQLITGFVSGAGTVSASDSILTAINKLDGNIALRALDSAVVHNTGNENIAGIKTFSSFPQIPLTNIIHISNSGSDTNNNGSATSPYASLSHAFSQITTASHTNPFLIYIESGVYSDTLVLKPNIWVEGNNCQISSSSNITLDSSFNSSVSISGIKNVYFAIGSNSFSFDVSGRTGSNNTTFFFENINCVVGNSFDITVNSPAVNGTYFVMRNCFWDVFPSATVGFGTRTLTIKDSDSRLDNCRLSTAFIQNNASTIPVTNNSCVINGGLISTSLTLSNTGTGNLNSQISNVVAMPATWTIDGANSLVKMYCPYDVAPTLTNSATFAPAALYAGSLTLGGAIHVTNTTASSSTSTGSGIFAGGIGVAGKIYGGGALNITDTTSSSSTTTGSGIFSGGVGIAGKAYMGGALNVTDTTAASSTTTGSGIFSGGVGIAGKLYAGGALNVIDTTASSSTTTGSGIFAGGVGIAGSVNIGANVNLTGSTSKLTISTSAGTQGLDLATADSYANLRVIQNTTGSSDKDIWIGISSGATSSLRLYSNNALTVFVAGGQNLGLGATVFAGGTGVLSIQNASVVPPSTPVGYYALYVTGGALKGRGTSGTLTNIGNADPHCKKCGSDFGLGWENPRYGGEMLVCKICETEYLENLRKCIKYIANDNKQALADMQKFLSEDISHVVWNTDRTDKYKNIRIPADAGKVMADKIANDSIAYHNNLYQQQHQQPLMQTI